MRICLVSEFYYPLLGGITEHIYGYAKQCLAKGHHVTLITSDSGKIAPELIPPGLELIRIGKGYPIISNNSFARVTLSPFLGTKLRNVLEKGAFDVVHIHSPFAPVLPLLAIRYKVAPTVGTLHTNFDKSRLYEIFQSPIQNIINKMDGIISVSPNGIDSLAKYFKFNAAVIPNGVDVAKFREGVPLDEFKNKPFKILFLGRMDPRNSVGLLLDAFKILQERKVDSHLIIAGGGPLQEYYMNSVPAQYKDRVTFTGPIHKQRPDFYASADAFSFPVSKACFSVTLLEAMAAGTPVVLPRIRAFADVIQHGVSGLLTKIDDPTDIADALQTLAEDPNLRHRLSENGKKKADEYSWDRVSDRILDYYSHLIEPARKTVRAV